MLRTVYLILSICSLPAFAQHNSDLGRFSIAHPTACAPVTIEIKEHDSFGDISRQYFYEEGMIETTDTFFTYTDPGVYQIVQFLGEDIQPKTDTLIFEVKEALPPEFEIHQCSEAEVSINITDDYYDFHIIKFSSTDSVVHYDGDGSIFYDYEQNSGSVQVFGFFENAYATCPDVSRSFTLPSSQGITISEASVRQACLDEYFLTLTLEDFDTWTLYDLEFKSGNNAYQSLFTGLINQSVNIFRLPDGWIDQQALCVRINAVNQCEQSRQLLDEKCFSSALEDSGLSNAYASYSGNEVLLAIDSIRVGLAYISRQSGNSSGFSLIDSTVASYRDNVPSLTRAFDYQLLQLDSCGNEIDSVLLSPPFLKLTDRIKANNTITIAVEPPVNELGDYSERLIFYNSDSSNVVEKPYETDITLPGSVGAQVYMRVGYLYADSTQVFSNEIITPYELVVFVPSAFTPNGDGLNDQLEIFGLPTNDFQFSIYNRWGEAIHTTNSNPVWDGSVGEKCAAEGSYLYRIAFRLENGELKTQVGTFTVLKQ